MDEERDWQGVLKLLTGIWMAVVLVFLLVITAMLWDIHQRETFVWHDENLVEVISRLDEDVSGLRAEIAELEKEVWVRKAVEDRGVDDGLP